jgi:hypothetical protein
MPQHYAYPPAFGGYYYFRPYNYQNVLEDIGMISTLNGTAAMPYSTAMFQSLYAEGTYEDDMEAHMVPRPFPTVTEQLPDLQDLLND